MDVYVYDFLLNLPQEMILRYLFIFKGQKYLIRFCFMWIYLYFSAKEYKIVQPSESLSKYSFQLYKKYVSKSKLWARQLFIALETELDRLVKRYGLKDSRPNEHFIKTVEKAAKAQGMTVAEYRDKILFPHGKERIIARFKKFIKLHSDLEGINKPPTKDNTSNIATRQFITKKKK